MPGRKSSKIQVARRWLAGGCIIREDSDDELGYDDLPWEWIYASSSDKNIKAGPAGKKRKFADRSDSVDGEREIVGARMGNFEARVGDAVMLKAADNQAWVGLICEFGEDEDGDKQAYFMWFSSPDEIRNKVKKKSNYLPNELYITPSWDWNPLTSVNGLAEVCSPKRFSKRFPTGKMPSNSKEYGKIFVCRMGCNTRTATYTNEFVWEDIYQGEKNLGDLIYLIQSQTKATRKRQAGESRSKKEDTEDLDFVVPDDEHEPRTPKKRRKHSDVDVTTPRSKNKVTPRKFLTPTHKRIVVKKALEITPLGTRILSPHVLSSPYQLARNQLHVSSVPASLPCREEEFSEVYSQLEKAITDGTGSCIYIAGTPGTGKTATVREVVAQLNAAVMAEELDDFIFVEINGMKVTDPHQSYSLLWEALRGDRVSPSHALDLLEREFSTPSPRRVPCVVLMDELDQLVTKNQSVMYNFFNWPGMKHSRLIVLAVANTMDLPERTLSNKISSRLGLHRITFKGYNHAQLIQIIESRLANVPGRIVDPDAIQFASRKVAAVSGDARRALDICRRAVEIAEDEAGNGSKRTRSNEDFLPETPSKKGRGKKRYQATDEKSQHKQVIVTIGTIKQAISEATSSPLQRYLRGLPLSAKVFLAALLARMRRTGLPEALVGDVADEARRLSLLLPSATTSLTESPVRSVLLAERLPTGDKYSKAYHQNSLLAPRMLGVEDAVQFLAAAGVLGVEVSRRGERVRRVRLVIADEEVGLALREDTEVKGLV